MSIGMPESGGMDRGAPGTGGPGLMLLLIIGAAILFFMNSARRPGTGSPFDPRANPSSPGAESGQGDQRRNADDPEPGDRVPRQTGTQPRPQGNPSDWTMENVPVQNGTQTRSDDVELKLNRPAGQQPSQPARSGDWEMDTSGNRRGG